MQWSTDPQGDTVPGSRAPRWCVGLVVQGRRARAPPAVGAGVGRGRLRAAIGPGSHADCEASLCSCAGAPCARGAGTLGLPTGLYGAGVAPAAVMGFHWTRSPLEHCALMHMRAYPALCHLRHAVEVCRTASLPPATSQETHSSPVL
ncbi:hypothetical protein NDU88_001636 [Pleurodeles waltl]|uniref:Uncharacterized protein n=1 Tax=Pleurodeles waltl TaxID=8319 RepID=A0AAV7WIX5_PLEWA|nr:hypothetical protein NDU88_001636 [Pleurodeles waltl]